MFQPNASQNKNDLDRFMRENLSVETNIMSVRRRPKPVRNLSATKSGSQAQVVVKWSPPQNASAVVGYHIYQDNENNRIGNVANPTTVQFIVALASTGSKRSFFVSSYNALLESVKLQVIVQT